MSGWSAAEAYERSFGQLCAGAVPALLEAVGATGSLLDVGTGPGTVAAAAWRSGLAVVAVDPEPEMVGLARRRLPGVDVRRAALPALPFADGSFDAAVANLVVNHLPDPLAGAAELLRVGRRVAVTIWPSEVSVLNRLWNDVRSRAGTPAPGGGRLPVDRDFARTSEGLRGLLLAAGAADAEVRTIRWTLRIDRDVLWSGVEAGIAQIGAAWRAADAAGRERMRAAYDELSTPLAVGHQLVAEVEAVLGTAGRARATPSG